MLEAALHDLAQASGRPVSVVTVELLRPMIPSILELAKLTRLVKQGRTEAAKRAIRTLLTESGAALVDGSQPDLFTASQRRRQEQDRPLTIE
jgi:hypothetical protein